MRADHFRDKRIETANQLPSRFIIVLQGSLNQLSRVAISHVVVEIVSTLLTMTEVDALRLQISWAEADKIKCNRRGGCAVTNYEQCESIK
jgi:hypothetical protein